METKNMTIKAWANVWLQNYKLDYVKTSTYTESYERTIKNYILPHLGDYIIGEISPLHVRSYMSKMAQCYSDSTLNKILICLNGVFNSAVENDVIAKTPAANITKPRSAHRPKEKKTYSQDEVNQIIEYSYNHEYGLYIHILLELGLRCSELCGLKWSDINFQTKTVNIFRACTASKCKAELGDTKNRSSFRSLPLTSNLTDRLLKASKTTRNTYIVSSKRQKNTPITPSSFTKLYYNPFFEDYGSNKRLSPHELRHTCGTLLYEKTKDIYAVSKFLGHSSINITAKYYVHADPDVLRSALNIT